MFIAVLWKLSFRNLRIYDFFEEKRSIIVPPRIRWKTHFQEKGNDVTLVHKSLQRGNRPCKMFWGAAPGLSPGERSFSRCGAAGAHLKPEPHIHLCVNMWTRGAREPERDVGCAGERAVPSAPLCSCCFPRTKNN